MTDLQVLQEVPGSESLVQFFGYWPSFHDAEVLSLKFDRSGPSHLDVHTFGSTGELDAAGRYICDRHVIVSFSFGEIVGMDLDGFNDQNVIFGLAITKEDDGLQLSLDPCYGVAGTILTKSISLTFEPGIPPGSVYSKDS